jgi:Kef-type K+ transport system membrane component KefB
MLLNAVETSDHDVVHDGSCGIDGYSALSESGHAANSGHEEGGHEDAFNHIYFVMLFIATLWVAGKLAIRLGMPALVGEIIFGIILGPYLLNLPGSEGSHFLIVIGEIGLIMLVVEAGIDVDIGLLKVIGAPALAVAVMGSIFPVSMGFCMSYLAFGTDAKTSIAVGACFGPTSMGIALNVLKKAKIVNTPTGQLIIAAAILDDVIALITLSELGALKDPSAGAILLPLIVSPILILLFGYLAIRWIPRWIKLLMNFVPKEQRENAILALLFSATFVMVPVCHFLGSSHLLGAFLAGLMFCTDHTIHHVWTKQIKRVLQWMLRIFFASTIGFAIPIREFTSWKVISQGLIFCFCMFGKVLTGFFARPLTKKNFFTIGFSMSAWGEFAFILATSSYADGTIDKTSFAAVLLAVLMSVIVSPLLLSFSIAYFDKQARNKMDEELEKFEGTNTHPVYYAINTKSRGSWGHQNKILEKLFNLQLEIIDFRSWHAPEYNHSHDQPLTKESFYVMDKTLALTPTKHLDDFDKEELTNRVKQIRLSLKNALGQESVINIKRWLPGVSKKDDQLEPTDDYIKSMFGGNIEYKPKNRPTVDYCRKEAFKQAHSLMSVFERKATLEDLRRQSSRKLMMQEQQRRASAAGDDEKFEHSLSFSEDEVRRMHAAKSYDGAKATGAGQGAPAMNRGNSSPYERKAMRNRANSDQNAHPGHAGMGHFGMTGAGGAGALPISDGMINIADRHWADREESDTLQKGKGNEESHMSYIYGDEDSQHHNLPEYSVENADYAVEMQFQPRLPQLAEDNDDDEQQVENLKDIKADFAIKSNLRKDGDETSEEEEANQQPSAPQQEQQEQQEQDGDAANGEAPKLKKKLTIKIYPPSMQQVSSRSPVASDAGSPHAYHE